jgi:2,4-dienoyl-CoA reductase-like NADH-dependent reductase (Old Yellow Enzyme family)/thioredoxin reductase
MNYPTLFSAVNAGRLVLKNRLMHAAITTSYAKDGIITEPFHNYYVNRAKGGVAALILEPSNLLSSQTDGRRLDIFKGRGLQALCRLVEAVENEDCRFIAQLQDNGRGRREQGRNNAAIGPSALPDDLSWTVPHVLKQADISRLIEEFTASCVTLQKAGFCGVELSAGHGHLFHQFLSSWSNHREDEYGGDTKGRTRLVRELIQSIRGACAQDFTIGLKLPGAQVTDLQSVSADVAEVKNIARQIAQTQQVDYWTFVWGSHSNSLHEHLPDAHGAPNPYMQDIHALRKVAPNIATGALGYMTDPNQAEKVLTDGTADIAMLGRPLITDPNWPRKAQSGQEADIRYCVSCNTCWQTIIEANKLQCDNNPRLGEPDEADWLIELTPVTKNITVVGSGVAGMEAAWLAAAKGHKVTVICQSDEVGGKTRIHALLPGGENLSSIYDHQLLMAQRYGVSFMWGVTADLQIIIDTMPDQVILATGAHMGWPSFLPDEYQNEGFFLDIRTLMVDLSAHSQKQVGKVVIYDQDHTEMTYSAAQRLAELFEQVVIVTSRERIASDVSLVARQGIYKRLSERGVEIITLNEPLASSAFEEGQLTLRNIYNHSEMLIDDVAILTYSTSRVPNDSLMPELEQLGYRVKTVGDAYAPRSVLAATEEGYLAAKGL